MDDILDESEVDWLENLEEDLIFQEAIFDTKRPPLMAPRITPAEPETEVRREELVNILVSKVYSGPTIGDVESALSLTCSDDKHGSGHQSRVGLPEKESTSYKMGNKYTLRIKTCLKGVAEDGYKWRKYGQKLIKNSPNPRSYYRCTNPRCTAKKQVERSTEDPETIIVTYEGLHLHYTYSHFLLSQKQDNQKTSFNAVKKTKIQPELQARESEENPQKQPLEQEKNARARESHKEAVLEDIRLQKASMGERSIQNGLLSDVQMQQGMLEDVVPLRVRKPSYFSQESSPSRHYSLFLSPTSSQIDMGILSSTL